MDFSDKQIAPPKSWAKFEDLCHALFQTVWKNSTVQKNGRQGQKQNGVDIFGCNLAQGGGLWGVQCKGKKTAFGGKLTTKEIDAELAQAELFEPPLTYWIIATTAANDEGIQKYARNLSAMRLEQGLFPFTIFGWDEITRLLHNNRNVAKLFYPEHFANLLPNDKPPPFHLPETRLSQYFSDPLNHLAALHHELTTKRRTAVLAAATVQGMGGVGKTQLAIKYCHQFRDQYAGIWWFASENITVLAQECMLFCESNDIAVPQHGVAPRAMQDWLATQPRWLLVYDNAEDVKALQKFLPHTSTHHVLITSRLRTWAGMGMVRLDVWRGDEALGFLRLRLPAAGAEQLLQLTKALDGLPLALEQACAYIDTTQTDVAAYIKQLNDIERSLRLLDREDSPDCPRSVIATLALAFDKLSETAKALLLPCGWLAPEPIPDFLFTESQNDLPEILQLVAKDEFAWRETVTELARYALCQIDERTLTDHVGNNGETAKCLVFHRLTQAAIRATYGSAKTGMGVCTHLIIFLHRSFPLIAHYPTHWPRCRTLMPHLEALHSFYRKDWPQQLRYTCLLTQLAIYLKFGPALFLEAEQLERLALTIGQEISTEPDAGTLARMSNLAVTFRLQGDLASARALAEKALGVHCIVLGEEHPEILTAMNNLAETLRLQDDLAGARTLQEKVLATRLRIQGEEFPATLTSMSNLASTLQLQGDLQGARALQEKHLGICRRIQGDEHPDTLSGINNLAITLLEHGDLASAHMLLKKVLPIIRRVLGEDHPITVQTKENLAVILENIGQTATAQALREEIEASHRRRG